MAVIFVIGTFLGVIAGYFGGIVDGVIMGVNNQKRNNYSETSQKSLNPYQAVMVRRR